MICSEYMRKSASIKINKINEIREERITNSIDIDSVTSHVQVTHLRFSTTSVNLLQLVFKIFTSQETKNLLITTKYMRCTTRFLSFRVDGTN